MFDPKLEKLAIDQIISLPIKDWRFNQHTACMSFLLSRSETAIDFIEPSHLKILLGRIKEEFQDQLESRYTKFQYAPWLLAGLLRYRIKEPHFLLLGVDPKAQEIIEMLETSLEDLSVQINDSKMKQDTKYHNLRKRYAGFLEEIQKYIKGDQGKSTLLLDIYNLDSGEPDDDN